FILHINSTGNSALSGINVTFVQGTLLNDWVSALAPNKFSSISATTNESFNVTVAIPKHTNPGNYTGTINITASDISHKTILLTVDVPADSSWISLPNKTITYRKSGAAGIAGSFAMNNTGNTGHNFTFSPSGNLFFFLWNNSNEENAYVEAGQTRTVSIRHLSMEGNSDPTIGSFNATITIKSKNTSQINTTFISLARDDTSPLVSITNPISNSFVKGTIEFNATATDLNLSRLEYFINNSLVINSTEINLTFRSFRWNTNNGSYSDEIYELKVIAFDSAGNFNTSNINVTVNNTDSPPILRANIQTINVIEDNDSTIFNLSLFLKSIDGDSLKYNFTKPNNVTVHVNNDTQIANFTPTANFSGINFIIFTAIDTSNQTTSSNNVTIDVANVNDEPAMPILLSPKNNSNISSATGKVVFAWNASKDVDGDSLTYYVFLSNDSNSIRLNATTAATSLELTGIDSNKKYYWNVLASDDKANSSKSKTFEFVLTGDNKPAINSWKWNNTINISSTNTSPAVAENKTLSFIINASDPDKDSINFTWFRDNKEISNIQNFTFDLTNNFTAAGAYTLKLTVTDNNSNSVSQEWQVTATNTNREPILDDISDRSIAEDSALNFNITVSDADNDSLSFSANISGIAFTKATNNSLATVSWTPTNDNVGDNAVKITANDGAKTDSKTIKITVTNTNDAPAIEEFFPKDNRTISENVGMQKFNATIKDADIGDNTTAYWFRNKTIIASNSSNVTVTGLDKGVYNITAIANDTSGAAARYEWKLTVTTDIVSENLTSPVLSLNETQRQNITNVTINQSAFGGIDFGNNSLNFSGIVKLEDAFNVSKGFVSVDTDTYPALKSKPASLLMKGLNFTKAPLIYRADGFESTTGAILCPADACTSIAYDKTNGALRFRAANFSTYFAQANTTNGAPVITSTAITSATERATYKYDVDASDPDGDTLIFSLKTSPSGMSISSSTGLITWVPSSSQLGANNVVVNVSDSNLSASQSFVIKVDKGSRLAISDLDITIDGKTDKNVNNNSKITEEAKPGSKVEFKIELENLFDKEEDLEIEDIDIEVTIEDIDDGDDLEEEGNGIDIKQGKDDTVNVEFEIPLEVEEGEYDVLINADGEDENNTRHEALFIIKLEVDKEQHEIRITNAQISPPTVQCQRQISINAEIMNTGAKDEDEVSLEISNPQLGISSLTEGIELDEGTDDNVYSKLLGYKISEDTASGVYPIAIKTKYGGKESDTEALQLEVKDCEKFKEVKKEVKEEKPKAQAIKPVTKIQPKAAASFEQKPTKAKDGRFLLVSILAIIFIGTAAFVIGGAFIVMRK
ncbi:MAG: putative Ig domain-containing protein, partial [Nanoarchaeota archaeon]